MTGFKNYLIVIFKARPFSVLFSCLLGVAASLFAAGLYGVACFLISLSALHPLYDVILVPAVLVRFFGLGRAVLSYLERYVSHNETFRILSDIRVLVYDSLAPLVPYSKASRDRGYNLSVAVSDVEMLQDGLLRIVYPIAVAVFAALMGTMGAYFLSPLLAVVFFFLTLPLSFVVFGLTALLSQKRQKRYDELRSCLYGDLMDLSAGLTDIKTNSCEGARQEHLSRRLSDSAAAQSAVSRVSALSDAAASFFSGLSFVILLAVSAALCAAQRLDGTLLAAAVVGLSYLTEPVSALAAVGARFERVKTAANRIFTGKPPHQFAQSLPAGFDPAACKKLSVDHLTFSYPGRALFKDISFSLEPGKLTVLTGKSGRGKSTIADLLCGFLTPEEGEIMVDGVSIFSLPEHARLRLFSMAEQSPHFFNDTLRANLLADASVSDETLHNILDAVGLSPFLKALPDGLDTMIFESGENLSGGELQRLSIARALLKKAPFYIFDEPTSSLDQLNEKRMIDCILSLSKTKGVLLITHRLPSELHRYDRIHLV
ncbi:thiol reductant ABC exporter subunit CydC [Oscillospiraceae bacterium WX1]